MTAPLPKPIRRHQKKDWLDRLMYWAIVLTGLYLIAQGVRLIL